MPNIKETYDVIVVGAGHAGCEAALANTLSNLEVGDMIPPELYTGVAEILVFVDKTDKLRGKING